MAIGYFRSLIKFKCFRLPLSVVWMLLMVLVLYQTFKLKLTISVFTLTVSETGEIETARMAAYAVRRNLAKNALIEKGAVLPEIFGQRQEIARQGCRKHFGYDATRFKNTKTTNWSDVFIDVTFYDDRYKFLFCTIPKVASTNIKEVLLSYLDRNLITFPPNYRSTPILPHIHRLIERDGAGHRARRNYTKILFVRHPIDRLISAWRDKFSRGVPKADPNLVRYSKHILKHYRKNATNLKYDGSDPITLEEFFRFILKEGTRNLVEGHWRQQVDHCDPCHVDYDYIGHFENLFVELAHIANVTTGRDISDVLLPPAVGSFASDELLLASTLNLNINTTLSSVIELDNDKRPEYFYGKALPPQLISDVAELYAKDFDIFGYDS